MMARLRSVKAVAIECGVARESLKSFLVIRPALKARMDALRRPKLTPEQRLANARRSGREYQQRYRRDHPEEARRKRREQMATYGPEYRHRWNTYNRLRRLGVERATALAEEYVEVLRGDPCCYCGARMEHVDHIEPIIRGGSGDWDNLTAACAACNLRKQRRPLLAYLLDTVDQRGQRIADNGNRFTVSR